MPAITLSQAEAQLAVWLAADAAVASSQSYQIGDRRLTKADAAAISAKISFWNTQVIRLSRGGGIRLRGAVPS